MLAIFRHFANDADDADEADDASASSFVRFCVVVGADAFVGPMPRIGADAARVGSSVVLHEPCDGQEEHGLEKLADPNSASRVVF